MCPSGSMISPTDPTVYSQTTIAGMVLAGTGVGFTILTVGSEHIYENFINDHMAYYNVTIILCLLGVSCGLFHVFNLNMGYAGDNERINNAFLGYTSLYLIYYGMAFWLVVMFAYSTSISIMVLLWVAFGVGPFVLTPLAKSIYHSNWRLWMPVVGNQESIEHGNWRCLLRMEWNDDFDRIENGMSPMLVPTTSDPALEEPGHEEPGLPDVMDSESLDPNKNIGGTIQRQPETSSAVIAYHNFAEAELAIRDGNRNNELLRKTKIKVENSGLDRLENGMSHMLVPTTSDPALEEPGLPDVTDSESLDHFKNTGGTIQRQPETSSAVIAYHNLAEAELAIRDGNRNNELLRKAKIKCSLANPVVNSGS